MENINETEETGRTERNELCKRNCEATTIFVVEKSDSSCSRDELSRESESDDKESRSDKIEEQVGGRSTTLERDLSAGEKRSEAESFSEGSNQSVVVTGVEEVNEDGLHGVVDDVVDDVVDNVTYVDLSWGALFNWDDFGYSLILGFAPTTWDVFSDLRIAETLEDSGDIYSAGLSYLFVCLPGLHMINETLGEKLSDYSTALVLFINLVGGVVLSSAMIVAFGTHPLLFRYPAILIGIAVVVTKGLAIFVHTPQMKKISKRVTMSEFYIESPLQLLLMLNLSQMDTDRWQKFLAPILSSLLVIGKVNAETYLSDEPENLMKGKTFLEKLLLTLKHIPFFAVTAFFRIGCVIINNQILRHTDFYSETSETFPNLFFFFTVWLGTIFFCSLYNISFVSMKVAFPDNWPDITMIEVGRGILAELTTVSNWGRLGRDRSRSIIIMATIVTITVIIITIIISRRAATDRDGGPEVAS